MKMKGIICMNLTRGKGNTRRRAPPWGPKRHPGDRMPPACPLTALLAGSGGWEREIPGGATGASLGQAGGAVGTSIGRGGRLRKRGAPNGRLTYHAPPSLLTESEHKRPHRLSPSGGLAPTQPKPGPPRGGQPTRAHTLTSGMDPPPGPRSPNQAPPAGPADPTAERTPPSCHRAPRRGAQAEGEHAHPGCAPLRELPPTGGHISTM